MDDRLFRILESGYTLRSALATIGMAVGEWEDWVEKDPGLLRRAQIAKAKAQAHREGVLITASQGTGSMAMSAIEALTSLHRLDVSVGTGDDRSPLERLLADPEVLFGLGAEEREILDRWVEAQAAAEEMARRRYRGE